MITLVRSRDAVMLKLPLWETLQELAKQEGWRPLGALEGGRVPTHSIYTAGRSVMARDARGLARALEKLADSEKFDELKIDLAPLVQLVNFVRGGAFEIR